MVAIGISSIVLLFSMQIVNEQMKLGKSLDEKISVNSQAHSLGARLGRILESAGGQGLAPYQAIFVENNCVARWVFPDCQKSDRITFLTSKIRSDGTIYQSHVVDHYNADGTVHIVPTAPSVCGPLDELNGEIVVLYLTTGEVMTRRVTGFNNTSCTLTSVADKQSEGITNTTTAGFLSAGLNVVKVITFFYDKPNKKVMSFSDKNGDSIIDQNEISSQFSDIFDFQIALGYDFYPKDGGISNNPWGGVYDEWLYNSEEDEWGVDPFLLTQVKASDLMMIEVACIVGVPTNNKAAPGTFKILDGPEISEPGYSFKKINRKMNFKNLMSF